MTVTALHSPVLAGLLDGAREAVRGAATVPVATVETEELGAAITSLAELESQVQALRMTLSAEADARRVADETAHTGTDAWLAQLTGDTRQALAGGLRIARLLQEKYDATREAFAAGRLRLPQVRVIVDAAEQAPPEATAGAAARPRRSCWSLEATGDATRSGRPMDARRLRQVARRMFDPVDRDLADRHESIILGRETRGRRGGDVLRAARQRQRDVQRQIPDPRAPRSPAAPRPGSADQPAPPVPGPRGRAGHRRHRSRHGLWRQHLRGARRRVPRARRAPPHDRARHPQHRAARDGRARGPHVGSRHRGPRHRGADHGRRRPPSGLRGGAGARGARRPVRPPRPRTATPAPRRPPASCPLPRPRHLRDRGLRPAVRVVRGPPPQALVAGRPHRSRQRPARLRSPPPTGPRPGVGPAPAQRR